MTALIFSKWLGRNNTPEPDVKPVSALPEYESQLESDLVRYYNRVLSYPIRLMYESVDFKLINTKKALDNLDYVLLIQLYKELRDGKDIKCDISLGLKEYFDYYMTPLNQDLLNEHYVTNITRKHTIYGQRVPDQYMVCLIYPNLGDVFYRKPRVWRDSRRSDVKLPYCYDDLDLGVILYLDDESQQSGHKIKRIVSLISEGLEELDKDRQESFTELIQHINHLIITKYEKSHEIVRLYESEYHSL